jgi:predicted HAD superfamily phosphohydrolase YqeG
MTGDMNDTLIAENGKTGEEEVERWQLSIEFTDRIG